MCDVTEILARFTFNGVLDLEAMSAALGNVAFSDDDDLMICVDCGPVDHCGNYYPSPAPTPTPCLGCGGRRPPACCSARRQLLSNSFVVRVRGSLSALGLATASEFVALVEGQVTESMADGSLEAELANQCACNATGLEIESFDLSQAYPTLAPTPFPSTPEKNLSVRGISWASLSTAPGLVAVAAVFLLLLLGFGCARSQRSHDIHKEGTASIHDIRPKFMHDFVVSEAAAARSDFWHERTPDAEHHLSLDAVYGGEQAVNSNDLELASFSTSPMHSAVLRRLHQEAEERRTGALAVRMVAPQVAAVQRAHGGAEAGVTSEMDGHLEAAMWGATLGVPAAAAAPSLHTAAESDFSVI